MIPECGWAPGGVDSHAFSFKPGQITEIHIIINGVEPQRQLIVS